MIRLSTDQRVKAGTKLSAYSTRHAKPSHLRSFSLWEASFSVSLKLPWQWFPQEFNSKTLLSLSQAVGFWVGFAFVFFVCLGRISLQWSPLLLNVALWFASIPDLHRTVSTDYLALRMFSLINSTVTAAEKCLELPESPPRMLINTFKHRNSSYQQCSARAARGSLWNCLIFPSGKLPRTSVKCFVAKTARSCEPPPGGPLLRLLRATELIKCTRTEPRYSPTS